MKNPIRTVPADTPVRRGPGSSGPVPSDVIGVPVLVVGPGARVGVPPGTTPSTGPSPPSVVVEGRGAGVKDVVRVPHAVRSSSTQAEAAAVPSLLISAALDSPGFGKRRVNREQ